MTQSDTNPIEGHQVQSLDSRTHARTEQTFRVTFKNAEHLAAEYTTNISAGGMFVASPTPPPMDSVIELTLDIPIVEREFTTRARVVHHITEQMVRDGCGEVAGFGVEFLDMSRERRLFIAEIVSDLHRLPSAVAKGKERHVLLIGADASILSSGVLRRERLRISHARTIHAVADYLGTSRPDLVVVHQNVLHDDEAKDTHRLLERVLEHRLLLVSSGDVATIDRQIVERLKIPARLSPRVLHTTLVSCNKDGDDFEVRMVDIGKGGLLMKGQGPCVAGDELLLFFDLPEEPWLFCSGKVVRVAHGANGESMFGIQFLGLGPTAQKAIRAFVRHADAERKGAQ